MILIAMLFLSRYVVYGGFNFPRSQASQPTKTVGKNGCQGREAKRAAQLTLTSVCTKVLAEFDAGRGKFPLVKAEPIFNFRNL